MVMSAKINTGVVVKVIVDSTAAKEAESTHNVRQQI
jgi:hypothetical protein